MPNRTPRQFIKQLNARPGSLASRSGSSERPGPKEIFRQRLEDVSNENQSRLARQSEIVAQKLEAICRATDVVNEMKAPEAKAVLSESEED